jgi:hypothetical protein
MRKDSTRLERQFELTVDFVPPYPARSYIRSNILSNSPTPLPQQNFDLRRAREDLR